MKQNKYYLVAGLAALFVTTLVVSGLASASEGDFLGPKSDKSNMDPERLEQREEHRTEMQAVIEGGDYDAWLEAMSDKPHAEKLTEQITAENFSSFVEMHQLMRAGDKEGAEAIAEEMGLERLGPKKGHRGGYQKGLADGLAKCQE